jgi:hypothetical protein
MARLLREPILHFLLIGLALFVYYGHVTPGDRDTRRIVVSVAQVDDLARQYQATWMRPPTSQELSGLVEAYVHDEILYREGRALGLDRDDPIIKRRVRQKLEVMSEEIVAATSPSDADLSAYMSAHPAAFRRPAIVSYEQILLAADGSDAAMDRRLAAARSALARGVDPATLGQATLLPRREDKVALDLVARTFGEQFAAQLGTLAIGQWVGPVVSGFGVHLVRINQRTPAALPQLEAVRAGVAREWEADRRKRALADDYGRLREKYVVVVEAKLPGAAPP